MSSKFAWAAAGIGLLIGVGGLTSGGLTGRSHAAGALSPIDKVVIENEINQQMTLYTLLLDGDGVNKADARAFADKLFTPNAKYPNYSWDGTLGIVRDGREGIYTRVNAALGQEDPTVKDRHFNVGTYFDEVTPTTAKTRTVAMSLRINRNMLGPDCKKLGGEGACSGHLIRATTFTYFDEWQKTPEGWLLTNSALRSDQ